MTCVFLKGDYYVGLVWGIVMALHVVIRCVSMEVPAHQLVTHLSARVLRYVKPLYDKQGRQWSNYQYIRVMDRGPAFRSAF